MIFAEFIEGLSTKLKEELPGQEAQRRMAPFETNQDRFNLEAKNEAQSGAVLILFYPDNHEIYFPLIQRPTYDGVHSDQVALPGGKREITDIDLIQTALREAREEIGIKEESIKIIGFLTELYIPVSNFRVLPVIGYSLDKPSFIPDNHEVKEIILANVEILTNDIERKVADIRVGEKYDLKAPYFSVEDRLIWGATAMMLSELQAVLIKPNLQ